MAFWLGTAAFALTILISVSLHELGHMITGKRFGMKVTKYFVGFGPTIFSFQRGETEYGLKAIPLGGFCKIVGMTPQDDDVAPEDQPRAMWRFPVWKRTVVMSAGSITHFMLALAGAWVMAVSVGLPNTDIPSTSEDQAKAPAFISVDDCLPIQSVLKTLDKEAQKAASGTCEVGVNGAVVPPAKQAGLQDLDRITKVGATPVATYGDLTRAIRAAQGDTVFEYQRDGQTRTTTVKLITDDRAPLDNPDGAMVPVSVAGLGWNTDQPYVLQYTPVTAFQGAGDFSWYMVENSFHAMAKIPEKIPALWNSITGEERDPDTPISVIGASRLGGEAIEKGVPEIFWQIFISLNIFIGLFNLLPLLPLDGGHIAIAWFERVRSWLYQRFRRPDPGRVDYYKLMPLTYAVILIGGAFTLLTATADIINPITIFK
ncbi:membrane-associated protease RseP (regulator of RpoE activity) [Actinoplanes octamycinicus]|uniref:Membrane-associated protease RseP (Regulator of RpoE activity) n=1 Tax=Actinoplanes octamycinicus TaxID=135948 RepID=A0A7W7M4R8_9ACTN|nr:site-2 protease family protein [Actinoplanes octamycinicus]MBB4736969.1 membrane-associated protease RseP (regulator of RpoE activity) [Actinoplanes octamycinicus]GIE62107.1 zinc metalloprotease Rip1 [Actinoplanes octamycinicus]